MKRGKKMILLLVALAVMVGGYYGIQEWNKKESVSETEGTFDLNAKTAEDLSGLSWKIGDAAQSFRLNDGVWETTDEPSWPVKQDDLRDLADQLAGLQATRKLEDVKNPGDYGLETPAATVTAVWKDGNETTYSMGDATPFADGYYLSLSDQEGIVYTIASSLSGMFGKSQKDLTAMEEIPSVASATGLKIGSTLNLIKAEESKTVDPDQLWYDAETGEPVDGSQAESLVSSASSIAWEELVTANADDESLEGWQLKEDTAVSVTLTGTEEETMTVLLGAEDENSHYYARLPGSSMVYTVKSDKVSSLLNASKESLQTSGILPMPYDTLAGAEFVTEKGTYTMERKTDSGETAESAEQAAEETAGETQPDETEEAQKNLWKLVTALKAEGSAENREGEQILSIHAVNTDGRECTAIFREYSADTYLAIVDGGTPRTVSAEKIDAIVRTVRSMK